MPSFDPSRVIVTVGGVNIQGFADGVPIKASRAGDNATFTVGLDGHTGAVINPNKSGEITLTLLQTSASNAVLTSMFKLSAQGFIGSPSVPISITDLSSTGTSVFAAKCHLKRAPDLELGLEIGKPEWVFYAEDIRIVYAGSVL